ncbi:hypothetical protein C8A05DRAFT_48066 [Staphylotrichum tortipilum]|uniref:Uncharacterized protein n=1 Tax=Staphylotrichum tortipilum TaxID=2831512 RepID=A0AAN6RNK2_9PEZI|nr:hypothetical protein C8A05DRAFT_48066 [Staphylotrichum longicolle]
MASQTCAEKAPTAADFLEAFFFTAHYTVELQDVCCRAGVNLNPSCIIQFFPNNSVLAYGDVHRGHFGAEPSVAGLGVANLRVHRTKLTQVLVEPPGWLHAVLKSLLVSASDTQLILALVYGINFGIHGKCTLSAYHYNVAVDIMVVSLTCLILSVYMLPDYWEAKLASALRVFVTLVIFAFLLRFLAYQFQTDIAPELMLGYRTSSTDSSLFLPMACFLDPDLNPFKGLVRERIAKIGGIGPQFTPELFFSIALAICYAVAVVTRIAYRKNTARPPLALTGAIVLVCVFSCCWCLAHTFLTWVWVDKSGWMEMSSGPGYPAGNPEMNVRPAGQMLPLATMIWVIIRCLNAKSSGPSSKGAVDEP